MLTLKLNRQDETPPGGWKYFQSETMVWLDAPSFQELIEKVKRHRKANNLPIGTFFNQEIESQICERAPAGVCSRDGHTVSNGSVRVDFDTVMNGTRTLLSWFVRGKEKVGLDESERRAVICSTCQFNQPVEGCAACAMNKLHKLAELIVGSDKFNGDHYLKACQKCGCDLKSKARLPLELLQKHTSPEVMDSLPDYCWLKK